METIDMKTAIKDVVSGESRPKLRRRIIVVKDLQCREGWPKRARLQLIRGGKGAAKSEVES
jgi:hypothetical protein